MIISTESNEPIYIQIAKGIETDIINGSLKEEEPAYSQYQIAKQYQINPATAAKGINLLVKEGVLIKKRGLSMQVAKGAIKLIIKKRRKIFLSTTIPNIITKANELHFSKVELTQLIKDFKEE